MPRAIAIFLISLCLPVMASVAQQSASDSQQGKFSLKTKKLIKEFQRYANDLPAQIRQEIQQFHSQNEELNLEKQKEYVKLSQEAQRYLIEEQTFRQKLLAAAANSNEPNAKQSSGNDSRISSKDHAKPQDIIDTFKKYVAKVPLSVQDEIQIYRSKINELNRKKRVLQKELSVEAQAYLGKERGFKKQLTEDINN